MVTLLFRTRTVAEVLDMLRPHWPELRWHQDLLSGPHEAVALALDSTKARTLLGWRQLWTLEQALRTTASWYRRFLANGETVSREQLRQYEEAAEVARLRMAPTCN